MVGPIDVKQKGMSQLDATLTRVPLTLTLTFDLWPWIFKVKMYLQNRRPDFLTLNFQGQIVSQEWEAQMSWNEGDKSW